MGEYESKIAKDRQLSRKYGKQSRLSQIMNIKVKAAACSNSRPERIRQQLQQDHSASQTSLHSHPSRSLSRTHPTHLTRFQHIMNIKVAKPSVCSTLLNYQPKKAYIRPGTSGPRPCDSGEDKENRVHPKNED